MRSISPWLSYLTSFAWTHRIQSDCILCWVIVGMCQNFTNLCPTFSTFLRPPFYDIRQPHICSQMVGRWVRKQVMYSQMTSHEIGRGCYLWHPGLHKPVARHFRTSLALYYLTAHSNFPSPLSTRKKTIWDSRDFRRLGKSTNSLYGWIKALIICTYCLDSNKNVGSN